MAEDEAEIWRSGFEPSTRDEAVDLLRHLSQNSGFVPEHLRSQTPPEVLAILAIVRRQLSSTAVKLSADLYTSDSRFLYELLQNADDNCYGKTQDPPTLTLILKRDELTLESNEDGFMRRHVEAISRVGQSTKVKTASQGYIGEKGIGFKSVFKVADKVHIKSEPYSFSFHYERKEKLGGLGMIAPLPQAYADMPEKGTQIILSHFHETDFETLRKELERIPNTLLLFLKQLAILVVRIETEVGLQETRWSKLVAADGIQEIRIQKSLIQKTNSEVIDNNVLRFFVKQKFVEDLAPDNARKTSDERFITNATIVLAFPLDKDDHPYIEEQYTYAFLPMRKLGFSFLIQSDFVTQSSREDVLYGSPRNKALRSRIPSMFAEAMKELCSRSSLKYTWVRYLPDAKLSSAFWQELSQDIRQLMGKQAILEPLLGTVPYSAVELKQTLSSFIDEDGKPMLRGSDSIRFISLKYAPKDCTILREIGLSMLTHTDVVELLRYDLKEPNSLWKSSARPTLWQSKLSSLLLQICKTSATLKRLLQSLKIVELTDWSWTCTQGNRIYMPFSGPASVPTDLGLAIVNSNSISVDERTALITELGVEFANTKEVLSAIYKIHKGAFSFYIYYNISHFVYMFWHEPCERVLPDYMRFLCKDWKTRCSQQTLFYDSSDHPLGPRQLFKKVEQGDLRVPGYDVNYLHDQFYQAVPAGVKNKNGGLSWREWLVKAGGILDKPRLSLPLKEFANTQISPELSYLIDYRPDVLVPLLKHHESFYTSVPPYLLRKFHTAKVWTDHKDLVALHDSILPTAELRAAANDLGIANPPFLHTGSEFNSVEPKDWNILDQFHVIKTKDMWFYVACLQAVCHDPGRTTRSMDSVIRLYSCLQKEYKMDFESKFRKTVTDLSWICIQNQGETSKWVTVADCLWQGPTWLRCKHVLHNIEQYKPMGFFFCNAVGLRDYKWDDALEELQVMIAQNASDFQKATEIYRELEREFGSDKNPKALRDKFEEDCLILSDKGWIQASVCLWAPNKIQVAGRVSIADRYATIEGFFLKTLKVEKPSIDLHIATLKELAKSRASFSRMKDVMENISHLKPAEGSLRLSFENLRLLPTVERDGTEGWTSLTPAFAIADKPRFFGVFNGHIRLLKLSEEEFWKIEGFLIACGLRARFLSQSVVEETAVDHAVVSQNLTHNIQVVGYALLRYAVHYRSLKTQDGHKGLFEALQKITVHRSDSISKVWTVTQLSQTISIPCSSADLHFTEEGDIRIFVPKDESALERCWPSQLISRFRVWLGVTDESGDAVLQNILFRSKENKLDALDAELEYKGIRVIEGVNRSLFARQTDDNATEDGNGPDRNTTPRPAARSQGHSSNDSMPRPSQWSSPRTSSAQPRDDLAQMTAYRKVLDSVIRAAQDPNILDVMDHQAPMSSIFVQTNIEELLVAFGQTLINGQPNWNRHKKVGAAGELFVVEILKRLCAPLFTDKNWQSTIRHEVKVHEKYADLDRWSGREISDIVYNDTTGALTQTLISCGHLDPEIWTDETANYFIEVKTTTGPCHEPFYVSSNQLSIMKKARLVPGSVTSDIYVLMRVYNLGQPDELGLRVYVDPYSAKKRGELVFHSDKYAVSPGRMPGNPDDADDSSDSDA